jgi:hypothetical protein
MAVKIPYVVMHSYGTNFTLMLTNHAKKTTAMQQESPGLWKQMSKGGGYNKGS